MNEEDINRFLSNYNWFNRFFGDLRGLFNNIASMLSNELPLTRSHFYYEKSRSTPSLPTYYVMGQGGDHYAIQIYAIIDPAELKEQTAFKPEPSLIVVKHSEGDKPLHVVNYGLRVVHNDRIKMEQLEDGIISGQIGGQKTLFQAFQVLLSPFGRGSDVNAAIENEIVKVLKRLPEFPPTS